MNEELKNTVFTFNRYAEAYAEKYSDITIYQSSLELFCNHLPINAELLELGCGPGNVTKFLVDKRPDLSIVATDLAEDMLKIAQRNLPSVSFQMLNFKNLQSYEHKVDALVAAFCLPYSSYDETIELIQSAIEKLRDNGLFYISTMEGNHKLSGLKKSSSGKDEMQQYFYEENWLIQKLQAAGFHVKYSELIPQPEESKSSGQDLVIIAQK